jgi:hypothetical protein
VVPRERVGTGGLKRPAQFAHGEKPLTAFGALRNMIGHPEKFFG